MTKTQAFNFDSGFASLDEQEEGTVLEVLRTDGTDSGMRITLFGPDSAARKAHARKTLNKRMRSRAKAATVEDMEAEDLEEMVVATKSWSFPKGFDGPACTPDKVREIYQTRCYILQQVRTAANDMTRFTSASRTN